MPSAQVGIAVAAAGVSIARSSVITTDAATGLEVTLPVAWPVTSWVKTDANTAAGNLASGHGQATGTYDVYWTGGQRLGVGVTITDDACVFEGGAGTDFPASATTTVVTCLQTSINTAIDGDVLELLAIDLGYTDAAAASVGNADFKAAASVELIALAANEPQVWKAAAAKTQFTGDPITTILASHSNITTAATLKIIVMQDSTP